MTEKERLLAALRGTNPERPPCVCPGGMMNMITRELMELCGVYLPEAHNDAAKMAELAYAVYEKGCFENCGVPFCMTVEAEAMGASATMGSDIFEPHITSYAIESVDQWQELKSMDLSTGRAKVVLDAIGLLRSKNSDVPIIGNITGPISTASSVMEPVVFYKQMRKKNATMHEYLHFVTEQLIAFACAQIDAGADVIAISDPSGTGEILGPKFFEEFAVKYINMLIDGIRSRDAGVIVHICGQMHSVYPQINMVSADALSFDSIVDLGHAGRNLPGRVLMGNVSTYALEFADSERVEILTRTCMAKGAGIISPACGLGMKSPISNIKAMLNAVKGGSNA